MCALDKVRKKVELLAPAGNKEAFFGAVHAGADAVYMGGEKFGARAYADNFSREELTACIRYGHIHGCRSPGSLRRPPPPPSPEEVAQRIWAAVRPCFF